MRLALEAFGPLQRALIMRNPAGESKVTLLQVLPRL